MSTSMTHPNIPYNQTDSIAIGYAQYALMQTLAQQFRVNYPAAFLHAAATAAAAATGYLPMATSMMPAQMASSAHANATKSTMNQKVCSHRTTSLESDDNNNHIPMISSSVQEQPYQRETYQTLLESSQLLRPKQCSKPIPIDLRKHRDTSRYLDPSEYSCSK
jgi:hypothetical protein